MSGHEEKTEDAAREEVLFYRTFSYCDMPNGCEELKCVIKAIRQEGYIRKLEVLVNNDIVFSVEQRYKGKSGLTHVYEFMFEVNGDKVVAERKTIIPLEIEKNPLIYNNALEDMIRDINTLEDFADFINELKRHYAEAIFDVL